MVGRSRSSRNTQAETAVVGITVDQGYYYTPVIRFDLGQQIGGPSAGLVFALAIYDKITPGDLLGTCTSPAPARSTADGTVGSIGGIQQKIASADDAGATVFLVPAANCGDLAGVSTDVKLVRVATLQDAIDAVGALARVRRRRRRPRVAHERGVQTRAVRRRVRADDAALVAVLLEIERHVAADGWDQPPGCSPWCPSRAGRGGAGPGRPSSGSRTAGRAARRTPSPRSSRTSSPANRRGPER